MEKPLAGFDAGIQQRPAGPAHETKKTAVLDCAYMPINGCQSMFKLLQPAFGEALPAFNGVDEICD